MPQKLRGHPAFEPYHRCFVVSKPQDAGFPWVETAAIRQRFETLGQAKKASEELDTIFEVIIRVPKPASRKRQHGRRK